MPIEGERRRESDKETPKGGVILPLAELRKRKIYKETEVREQQPEQQRD